MSSVWRNPSALTAMKRLKTRDEYTYGRSLSVSALMASFAQRLEMSEQELFERGLAGLLHNIGKMLVPDRILRKPESLTDDGFALVRTHSEQGCLLLGRNPATGAVVLDVCRRHHERPDGSGYPFAPAGDAISRPAEVAATCEVYDAPISNRSYKPPQRLSRRSLACTTGVVFSTASCCSRS